MFLRLAFLVAFHVFLFSFFNSYCFSGEGISWGQYRLSAGAYLSEDWTDNIFLDHKNRQNDLITTFSPSISVDYAITPANYFSLNYEGKYRYYKEADNFRKDTHKAGVRGSFATQKGSLFNIGAKAGLDSIQPYSEEDNRKDFLETEAYADVILKLFSFTDIGLKYNYLARDFNKSEFAVDEFNSHSVSVNFSYNGFSALYPVIDYIFTHQDNNDLSSPSTDLNTHIFLLGVKWDPESRLSGYFKAGYYMTKLDNGLDSDGFALDMDLTYKLTEIITIKADGFRRLIRSTSAARESGVYYISSGGNFTVDYKVRDSLSLSAVFSYTDNSFHDDASYTLSKREDKRLGTSLNFKYVVRDWLSLMLAYKYNKNNSNEDTEDYRENRVEMRMTFSL